MARVVRDVWEGLPVIEPNGDRYHTALQRAVEREFGDAAPRLEGVAHRMIAECGMHYDAAGQPGRGPGKDPRQGLLFDHYLLPRDPPPQLFTHSTAYVPGPLDIERLDSSLARYANFLQARMPGRSTARLFSEGGPCPLKPPF